ncbi:TonB-dependent receptor [Salinimonas lutimaris]|uniref:TonB-dependent receptor n=1 Tax=Salinimonas lutimaris TaxID=914153 RepID=UPI0010C035D1|nr:TonB-dependent receptor [Salinimonas lutimaris]
MTDVRALSLLASAIAATFTPAISQAAQSNSPDADSQSIEHVVTTSTRIAGDTTQPGIIVDTIGPEDIALTGSQHIQEMLNFVAGAGVQRGNGQEYLPALRSPVLTGSGACGGILAAEDNIPLRAAGFCNINELFEAHSEMAQRIEVLKGPASVLYGSNAIHGVINVITPDTTRDVHMLGYDYGSYGYNRVKLRQGKDFGNSGIGINASITRDTGYRDEEGVDQEKVNLRHRYNGDDVDITTGLTYTHLDQETAGYISGFESYKNEALAQTNEDPGAFREATALRIWSRIEMTLNNGDQLSVTPYVRDQDMDFRMHFLPGTPLEQNEQQGAGVQTQYRHQLSTHWSVDAGLDVEFTQGSLRQYQDSPTTGSAFLVETVPQGQHYDYEVDATMVAPYAALNWADGPWQVQFGARYEYMNYDYTNNLLDGRTRDDGTECGFGGCRYSRPASTDNSFSNLSPKASLSYAVSPQTQVYASVSRGYRAPQASELYRLQRDQQLADLVSVTATNVETGVKGNWQALDYQVSVYSLRKDNVIYRDSDFFNVSNGETWHRGVELSLDYALTDQWQLAFAGTYARHTYEHNEVLNDINIHGNDVDTAPKVQTNTRLTFLPDAHTQVALEWQHVDDYYTDPENLHEYEGHDLLNLRTAYDFGNGVTVFARVNNLLDERYAERADYSSFSGDRYFPSRPRNYMLSVQYDY